MNTTIYLEADALLEVIGDRGPHEPAACESNCIINGKIRTLNTFIFIFIHIINKY